MNLIDIYIEEVTRRLPEKNRDDISLELRSTIEDMLPEDYNEDDVKEVLEKLGSPVALANGYRDRPTHLIGPRYYDIYVSLLKLILPIAAIVSLFSVAIDAFFTASDQSDLIKVILETIGLAVKRVIEVGVNVFFWVTIVFAVTERLDKDKTQTPLTANLKQWTVDDLKHVPYIPKKKAIRTGEVVGAFLWTAIWSLFYFYADRFVGIYSGGQSPVALKIPAFNQDVLLTLLPLVVIVIVLEVTLAVYKFIQRKWTIPLAIVNTIVELIGTIVFAVILLQPHVWNVEFISYLSKFKSVSVVGLNTGLIVLATIFTVLSIVDGFRKAKIPEEKM
jgi:hypothetical protein